MGVIDIPFHDFTIDSYNRFLKCKGLPSYQVKGHSIITEEANLRYIEPKRAVPEEHRFILSDHLFDYQLFITQVALKKRRYALFADCGLGKAIMLLEFAFQTSKAHNKKVLIVMPLNIISQLLEEQMRFYGHNPYIDLGHGTGMDLLKWIDSDERFGIVNYDKFHETIDFKNKVGTVINDESSILKNPSGAIRNSLIDSFLGVEYKLACTATPAPNDTAEYASHALFLEKVKSYQEFFQTYFIQDEGEWRLKKHAVEAFYTYLSTWSIFLRNPKMYGFADNLADLQEYVTHEIHIPLTDEQLVIIKEYEINNGSQPSLLPGSASSMTDRIKFSQVSKGFIYDEKKKPISINSLKPGIVADIVINKHPDEQSIIWTTYTEEGVILKGLIPGAVHLYGSVKEEERAKMIEDFRTGKIRVLITKPKLLGFGLNFQFANIQVFSGLDDSYEKYYQAIKRSHRYGAKKQLIVYIPITSLEEPMLRNVLEKKERFESDAAYQERLYITNLRFDLEEFLQRPLTTMEDKGMELLPPIIEKRYELYNEDCIQFMARTPDETFDMSFFSPPFDDLYTYSDNPEDLSNCQRDGEFRLHNDFFFAQLYRVMKSGRVVAIHIAQNAKMKFKDGTIGLIDLRGQFINQAIEHGFEYFSEACIERSPQLQMHKEKMLFHKNISTNALNTKLGMNYYVIFLKKKGDAVERVKSQISLDQWYTWASGVWKVNESDYLNVRGVKAANDERHVTPTNLEIIRRSLILYSNPGDKVYCPYGGCGSEGVESIKLERYFTMTELKPEYFIESIENVSDAHNQKHNQLSLF